MKMKNKNTYTLLFKNHYLYTYLSWILIILLEHAPANKNQFQWNFFHNTKWELLLFLNLKLPSDLTETEYLQVLENLTDSTGEITKWL